MQPRPILLTGFGPFERVERNPSGAIVEALAGEPGLATAVLPVTFRGSAEALDDALAALPAPPAAIVCLGVHPGGSLRLERRAGPRLRAGRPDTAGEDGAALSGAMGGGDRDLETDLDLGALAGILRVAGGPEVEISADAGGYVCERVYRHALLRARERGIPALFLHVPPEEATPLGVQRTAVRALLEWLRASLG